MKKIFYISLLAIATLALFSNSNGNFTADYTGTTGLGQSCAQVGCHEGIGTMGVDTNKILVRVLDANNIDVNSYTLNQQYTVEIKFKLHGATKVGFQCTSLFGFSSNKAGVVSNTLMPANIQVYTDGSGREYLSHTSTGGGAAVMSNGYAIWRYRWTAPSTSPQAIFFNVAVNRSNNDNTLNGDSIFVSTMKVLQLPTSTSSYSKNDQISLYPNPANTSLSIQTDLNKIESYSIFDLQGRKVIPQTKMSTNTINISNLNKGNYILELKSGESSYTKIFTKIAE